MEGAPLSVVCPNGVGITSPSVALTAALLSMWKGRLSWRVSGTACSHNRMAAQQVLLCMHTLQQICHMYKPGDSCSIAEMQLSSAPPLTPTAHSVSIYLPPGLRGAETPAEQWEVLR